MVVARGGGYSAQGCKWFMGERTGMGGGISY